MPWSLSVGIFGVVSPVYIPLVAAAGALGAAGLAWGFASAAPGGATSLTLVLSGAVVTAFLSAFITLAHLLNHASFENLRVWLTGASGARDIDVMIWAVPWAMGGMALAFGLARQVTALSMGDEAAAGLGVDVVRLKGLALLSVVVLTAASVAIAGPLGFFGLVIPHAPVFSSGRIIG